jgi:hypothetical protein
MDTGFDDLEQLQEVWIHRHLDRQSRGPDAQAE